MRIRLSQPASIATASLIVVAALSLSLIDWASTSSSSTSLRMFCAAGIKRPVAAIAKQYEAEYGVQIELTYGGSGTLLSNLKVSKQGDLYLAGDDSFTDKAQSEGLARERFSIATMQPVFGTAKGNPKQIKSWQDLLRTDVRVGLASPDAAAVGKISKQIATAASLWDALKPKVTVFKPTVSELANDLLIGAIDVAVIWDATAAQHQGITTIPCSNSIDTTRNISLCVLESSRSPTAALQFARYLSANDRGLRIFEEKGFKPVDGDSWAVKPELEMFCGAMLNQAIDSTVAEFEQREGVTITRIYNGCGILVAQMQSGAMPDAYFSCDESFLSVVQDRFGPGDTISDNDIILLVQKGNPKQLDSVHDLTRKGLRIGLGHPKKSALGSLTAKLLDHENLTTPLQQSNNVVVESPTGDFLVNQLRTGSLDATLVYRSNATAVTDHLTIIPISGIAAGAAQPYAIAKHSAHKHLLERLRQTLHSQASRARFISQGFTLR